MTMGGSRPPSLPLPLVKIGLALVCGLAVGCMLAGLKGCAVAPRREHALRKQLIEAEGALARANARVRELKRAYVDSQADREGAEDKLAAIESDVIARSGSRADAVTDDALLASAFEDCRDGGVHEVLPVRDDGSELSTKLKALAIDRDVLVAVSNKNLAAPGYMLEMWVRSVQRAGVTNYLVVALDGETARFLDGLGAPNINMEDIIPAGHGQHNHAVSALKFRILERFLKLGYSVLMSDVDVLVFEDPFKHLKRDADIEAMSDGYDDATAYGYNDVFDDPSMGWSRYAHTMRVFVFNSGLFYVRASAAGLRAMQMTAEVLATKGGWDQAVFNEVISFPLSPVRGSPMASRRVVDFRTFVNSKTFFRYMRKEAGFKDRPPPCMIHLNYHPDKFERLKAIEAYYIGRQMGALDQFTG